MAHDGNEGGKPSGDKGNKAGAGDDLNLGSDAGMAPQLTYLAVAVGLFLIVVGVAIAIFAKISVLSSLMTCVGFGIVLAAFGARAIGRWNGWTVGGSGALTLALFLAVQFYEPAPRQLSYKTGSVMGNLNNIADLHIVDESPMYQYRDATTNSVRFIIIDRKFRSPRIKIQVDTTEKGEGKEYFEMIGDARMIAAKFLENPNADEHIQWDFDYAKRVIRSGNDVIFSETGRLQDVVGPSAENQTFDRASTFASWLGGLLSRPAQAENASGMVIDPAIFDRLTQEDSAIRRATRDNLASLGPKAVPAMMQKLRDSFDDYRIKLGITYALAEMLRANPALRKTISAQLKDADFPLLVRATQDDYVTTRLQAGQFLYLLQDPRSIPASVDAAASTEEDAKSDNQLLIIRQAGKALPGQEKKNILETLSSKGASQNKDPARFKNVLGWD